jgi:dienelactone hydrolase
MKSLKINKVLLFTFSILATFIMSLTNIAYSDTIKKPGSYEIGYQINVFIDTSRDINQINKVGEPNGRRLETHIWYPVDKKDWKKGVDVHYDSNMSTIPDASALNLMHFSYFPTVIGTRVAVDSVLPIKGDMPAVVCSFTQACPTAGCDDCVGRNLSIVGLPVKNGAWPVIVFHHGRGSSPQATSGVLELIASAGFIVIAPEFNGSTAPDRAMGGCAAGQQRPCESPFPFFDRANRALDLAFVLNKMLIKNTTSIDTFYGHLDPDHIGVLGYSAGQTGLFDLIAGRTGVIAKDPRIKAAMGWSTGGGDNLAAVGTNVDIPVMILTGTQDSSRPVAETAFNTLLTNPNIKSLYFLRLLNSTHNIFTSSCSYRQGMLDSIKNGNINTASRNFLRSSPISFSGVIDDGAQAYCDRNLFYNTDMGNYSISNYDLWTTPVANGGLGISPWPGFASWKAGGFSNQVLYPANILPGYVAKDLAREGQEINTMLDSVGQPIIADYTVEFFKAYLDDKNNDKLPNFTSLCKIVPQLDQFQSCQQVNGQLVCEIFNHDDVLASCLTE